MEINIKAQYGQKIKFEKDVTIQFPDFSIKYIGTRKVGVPRYVHGFFTYYDFEIGNGKKIVSWSAGTGDIGPQNFNFKNGGYQLELQISYKLGKLDQNELVVWKL